MEETITFWLDNKICSGFKISEIGTQTLVSYRDKYYIVVGGAALMKGVRPLHYSRTSMPLIWKKAMKGILPPPAAPIEHGEDEFLPVTTSTKKERTAMKNTTSAPAFPEEQPLTSAPTQNSPKKSAASKTPAEVKPAKIIQSVVAATCPYCSHKQDLPFEKGKNGKPFFVGCVRCSTEFAVRFVPVTMYQAQVAAFK
jgi:DNA-directed RNA polymerase subunit RPC12/RpoP